MITPAHPCLCGAVAWETTDVRGSWKCQKCGEVCPCYPTGAPSLRWVAKKIAHEKLRLVK